MGTTKLPNRSREPSRHDLGNFITPDRSLFLPTRWTPEWPNYIFGLMRSRLENEPKIVTRLEPKYIDNHWLRPDYLIEPADPDTDPPTFKILGDGKFGITYAAIQHPKNVVLNSSLISGIPVAMKSIKHAGLEPSLENGGRLGQIDRLRRLMHPGLILVDEFYIVESRAWFVTERVGENLQTFIDSFEHSRLSDRLTKFIACQLLEALGYLHKNRLLHGNLKVSNVLMAEDHSRLPLIKLSDFWYLYVFTESSFWLTKLSDQDPNNYKMCLHERKSLFAPELLSGDMYDQGIDLYAAGCLISYMLTGSYLITAEDLKPGPRKTVKNNSNYESVDLVLSLHSESRQRPTAEEALMHAWFQVRFGTIC